MAWNGRNFEIDLIGRGATDHPRNPCHQRLKLKKLIFDELSNVLAL